MFWRWIGTIGFSAGYGSNARIRQACSRFSGVRPFRGSQSSIQLEAHFLATKWLDRMKVQVQVEGETLIRADLWIGICSGPFSWALDEVVRRSAVAYECSTGQILTFHLLTFGALMGCALGFLCAWKASPVVVEAHHSLAGGEESRRTMATAGMILSLGFALVIMATAIPQLTLSVCN
jgi:hypothetical protein